MIALGYKVEAPPQGRYLTSIENYATMNLHK
jgi:hypothetical protein